MIATVLTFTCFAHCHRSIFYPLSPQFQFPFWTHLNDRATLETFLLIKRFAKILYQDFFFSQPLSSSCLSLPYGRKCRITRPSYRSGSTSTAHLFIYFCFVTRCLAAPLRAANRWQEINPTFPPNPTVWPFGRLCALPTCADVTCTREPERTDWKVPQRLYIFIIFCDVSLWTCKRPMPASRYIDCKPQVDSINKLSKWVWWIRNSFQSRYTTISKSDLATAASLSLKNTVLEASFYSLEFTIMNTPPKAPTSGFKKNSMLKIRWFRGLLAQGPDKRGGSWINKWSNVVLFYFFYYFLFVLMIFWGKERSVKKKSKMSPRLFW